MGVVRRFGVLELRVFIDPIEPECLGSILLMNQRDLLAVDDPVVALNYKVMPYTPADEFRTVACEPELYSERMPVMLARETVGARTSRTARIASPISRGLRTSIVLLAK